MKYAAIRARQGQLQAVTGLSGRAFEHLHTVFSAVVEHQRRHYTLQGTLRQRARSHFAGRLSPYRAPRLIAPASTA
ncbi:hypothetical protein [Hymenobacter sp. IS2118]|uniref:hypothetical protein n=1 Tax=Hymenobacter sp. IS2118 TaxID=1505605 RepID=UPI0005512988|nr:hypothetical protein [Hymenobacter sp. IS2118]